MPNTPNSEPNNFLLNSMRLQNKNLLKDIAVLQASNKTLVQAGAKAATDIKNLLLALSSRLSDPEFYAILQTLQVSQIEPTVQTETDGPDADPLTGIPYGALT